MIICKTMNKLKRNEHEMMKHNRASYNKETSSPLGLVGEGPKCSQDS